jgi:hypothetical protein
MGDGLHLHAWKRTMKLLTIALSGDLTNVQYKPIWNRHNEILLCNEYILIKMGKRKRAMSPRTLGPL